MTAEEDLIFHIELFSQVESFMSLSKTLLSVIFASEKKIFLDSEISI